jgi:hypothetical protein
VDENISSRSGKAPVAKREYLAPKLTDFGTVKRLAQGGAGSPAEMGNSSSHHKLSP